MLSNDYITNDYYDQIDPLGKMDWPEPSQHNNSNCFNNLHEVTPQQIVWGYDVLQELTDQRKKMETYVYADEEDHVYISEELSTERRIMVDYYMEILKMTEDHCLKNILNYNHDAT